MPMITDQRTVQAQQDTHIT